MPGGSSLQLDPLGLNCLKSNFSDRANASAVAHPWSSSSAILHVLAAQVSLHIADKARAVCTYCKTKNLSHSY